MRFDLINLLIAFSFFLSAIHVFIALKCLVARRWRGSQGPNAQEREKRYRVEGKGALFVKAE